MPFTGIRPVCVTCGDFIVNFQRRTIKRCPPCRNTWDRERRRLNSLAHYRRNRERRLAYTRRFYQAHAEERRAYGREYMRNRRKEVA